MIARSKRVLLEGGWIRALAATIAGALGALAMPPFGILPAFFVSLSFALWLISGSVGLSKSRSLLRAASDGWFWGFGYFVAGLWWLGAAFLVEADQFAWAMPLGVLGLPALLALFFAGGFVLTRFLWLPGVGGIVSFAAGLWISEWARGHLFTGFPWNSLGMALGQNLFLMQIGSLIGQSGMTWLAVLICASPTALILPGSRLQRAIPFCAALGILIGLGLYGFWRVPQGPVADVSDVRLRIMQPNIQQDAKFRPENASKILKTYLDLSTRPDSSGGQPTYTHLIWPESAFPFLLHRTPQALTQIAAALPAESILVTGAARMGEPLPGESVGPFFNAVQVLTPQGTIEGTYDKVHLVPFGEYVPTFVETLIKAVGLRAFVALPGGFQAGSERKLLTVSGLPAAAVTICYEAIFSGDIVPSGSRPGLILNLTNDGWFGHTPGPYQHLAQSRLRAVEEGLPLVRAANTGISAIIDPYGRLTALLPLGEQGLIDAPLPMAIAPTIFDTLGSVLPAAMLISCLSFILIARWLRRSYLTSLSRIRSGRVPEHTL